MVKKASEAKVAEVDAKSHVVIKPLNMRTGIVRCIGTAPYVQNKFGNKERDKLHKKHAAGDQPVKTKAPRPPKDFEANFEGAMHRMVDGRAGIPATAFRNAMIDACRVAGFVMTRAKMTVFVGQDGYDPDDGTPMVAFDKGEPAYTEMVTRNSDGTPDLRVRPMWAPGWEVTLRLTFDADQFSLSDVVNLLARAGAQVGVGEGRPFSKNSNGMGWGTFRIAEGDQR